MRVPQENHFQHSWSMNESALNNNPTNSQGNDTRSCTTLKPYLFPQLPFPTELDPEHERVEHQTGLGKVRREVYEGSSSKAGI